MKQKKLSHLGRIGSLTVVAVMLASILVFTPPIAAAGEFEIKPAVAIYDDTTDIEVFNATGGSILELYDATGQKLKSVYADGNGYGTFTNINFNSAGDWIIKDVDGNRELTLMVNPAVTLTITVTPEEIVYTKGAPSVDISGAVTDEAGSPVDGALVTVHWIDKDGNNQEPGYSDITGADGTYSTAVFGLRGVGHYNITAEKDLTGGPENEIIGFTQLPMVTPSDLTIEDVSTETVYGGFTGTQTFSIKYTDDNTSFDFTKPLNITLMVDEQSNYTGDITGLPAPIFIDDTEIQVDESNGNMTLAGRWPLVGTWTVMVQQNYEGDTLIEDTVNHSYEYMGTALFDVLEPVPVSVDVITPTIDVKSISTNFQTISLTIIGESETEFGDEAALTDNGNVSIMDAIQVTGDILYTLEEDDYIYQGDGTWDIEVFPALGGGEITLTVNWPGRTQVTDSISIGDGRVVSIDITEVVVDLPVNITAVVTTSTGTQLTEAKIDLIYEDETVPFHTITGDETENNGLDGRYVFEVNTTQPHKWVIVYVTEGGKYAYAKFWSGANSDLTATISPARVLAGEHTEFVINVSQNGNYIDAELYLFNQTDLTEIQNDQSMIDDYTPITPATNPSAGNYTYEMHYLIEETYYLYAVTADKRHDNLNGEPSFEVTKATVAATPSMLAKKVDDNTTVTFTVTWDGQDVSGTLKILGINPADNSTFADGLMLEADVVNGTVQVHHIMAMEIGNITFEFKPEMAGSEYYETAGELKVVPPAISVEPATAVMGTINEITITVKHPATNAPSPDLTVTAILPGGGNEITLGTTNSAGEVSIGMMPSMTGFIQFFIEGDPVETTIPVLIGMEIKAPEEVSRDDEVTIKVHTTAGKPVSGANVYVDGANIGTTDADGEIIYKAEEEGIFDITATHSVYELIGTYEIEVIEEAVPGFEAVAILIAFIGAAVFIYRRRK